MRGRLRYLLGVGLTISSLVLVAASSDFETALTDALAKSKTEAGTNYIPKYSDVLGDYVTSAMTLCGPKFPDMSDPAYIVLTIAGDGRITHKLAEPNSEFGRCVAAHFPERMKLPHPPEDGWSVVVGVQNRFHAEGRSGGAASSKASLAVFDGAIAPYVAQGRATYPAAKQRFLKGLPVGNKFMVRVRLTQKPDRVEEAFIEVSAIQNGKVSGTLNRVDILTNYRKGERMTVPESEIKDWLIQRPDGSVEGNAIGKFLKKHKA